MKNLNLILKRAFMMPMLLLATIATAQEKFYFRNGNPFSHRLTEAADGQVKYEEVKGERILKRSFQRENVLVAFNAAGKYLMITDISTDPAQAKQQLQTFYNDKGNESDVLIQAVPLTIIAAHISYESTDVVNYNTLRGTPASMNRSDLVAIIYEDGRHKLLRDITEVAPLLAAVSAQIKNIEKEPAPTTSPNTADLAKPFVAQRPAPITINEKPSITEAQREEYQQKAIEQVEEFVRYLNVITDKRVGNLEKEQAIEQAIKLFLPDATIEVNSALRGGTRRYNVREYLRRLKHLPYRSAKIEWTEIQYLNELKQAADGSYNGTIRGTQTFTGFGANNSDVAYSDVTEKEVKVKLESYQRLIEGQEQTTWQVLLGNIGVAVNPN